VGVRERISGRRRASRYAKQLQGSSVTQRTDSLGGLEARHPTSATPPPCGLTSFPVANAGFEDGSFTGWRSGSEPGGAAEVVLGGAQGSKYAAQLHTERIRASPGFSQVNIDICPASNYSLSYYYRVPHTAPNCSAGVGFGTYQDIPAFDSFPLHATDWTRRTFTQHTFAAAHLTINAIISCNVPKPNATVLFDNFAIEPIPGTLDAPGCPMAPTIPNGGFETGTIQDWNLDPEGNVSSSVVSPGYGPGSQYMFQVDFYPPPSPVDSTEFILSRDDINLCIAYNYTFSFDYRFENYDYANNPNYCQLLFSNSICDQFSDHPLPLGQRTYPPKNTWTHVDFPCRATDTGSNIFYVLVGCRASQGVPAYNFTEFSFQFDNAAVKLRPVTEYW
jgi:hypothetical protein